MRPALSQATMTGRVSKPMCVACEATMYEPMVTNTSDATVSQAAAHMPK